MKKNIPALKDAVSDEVKKIKEDLLNSINHDFKTPITAILGYANLILENKNELGQENAEYLYVIIKSAKKLDKMVNKVLNNRL